MSVEHYVPRLLLKNFCTGKKLKLWAYDKSTGKSFETNIQNVARERDFYEVEIGSRTLSLEEGLGAMESNTAAVIDRILAQRSIGSLSENDRIRLRCSSPFRCNAFQTCGNIWLRSTLVSGKRWLTVASIRSQSRGGPTSRQMTPRPCRS